MLPQWSPGRSPGGNLEIYNVLYAYKAAPGVDFADIKFYFFLIRAKGGMAQVAQW